MLLITSASAAVFSKRFNLNNGVAVDPVGLNQSNVSEQCIGFQTPDGAVLKYHNFKRGWIVEIVSGRKCYFRKCISALGAHRLFQDIAARSMHIMASTGSMKADHGAQLVDIFGLEPTP